MIEELNSKKKNELTSSDHKKGKTDILKIKSDPSFYEKDSSLQKNNTSIIIK